MSLPRGQTLAASASNAPPLYLLREGTIVLRGRDGTVLEQVGPGGFVGEEVCLDRQPPPWNWVAQADCELLAFATADLRGIPVVLWKLLETHERRLRSIELINNVKAP